VLHNERHPSGGFSTWVSLGCLTYICKGSLSTNTTRISRLKLSGSGSSICVSQPPLSGNHSIRPVRTQLAGPPSSHIQGAQPPPHATPGEVMRTCCRIRYSCLPARCCAWRHESGLSTAWDLIYARRPSFKLVSHLSEFWSNSGAAASQVIHIDIHLFKTNSSPCQRCGVGRLMA
jgi:hypothetical protein